MHTNSTKPTIAAMLQNAPRIVGPIPRHTIQTLKRLVKREPDALGEAFIASEHYQKHYIFRFDEHLLLCHAAHLFPRMGILSLLIVTDETRDDRTLGGFAFLGSIGPRQTHQRERETR